MKTADNQAKTKKQLTGRTNPDMHYKPLSYYFFQTDFRTWEIRVSNNHETVGKIEKARGAYTVTFNGKNPVDFNEVWTLSDIQELIQNRHIK